MIQSLGAIKGLWDNRKLIGLGILVAALLVCAFLAHSRGQERDKLKTAYDQAVDYINDQKAVYDATVAAMERKVESDKDRNRFEIDQAGRNSAGRVSGDGPLSPVLRDGLRAVAERQAARNDPR